ncbi:MAG TPA: metallophosphoesterase, partial [Opitutus sp.]|nr:metallophosphoesterase [Opitutus sp.]
MTRIFSDLHYGDRASTLRSLADVRPLLEGCSSIVLNGDTLDTRPSRTPEVALQARSEVNHFFAMEAPPTTWLTGNHDPDISDQHAVELNDRLVYVTHGDILFENLVPWGRDADDLSREISAELARFEPNERTLLAHQFIAFRRAAAAIPQRHQSERNTLKYLLSFSADTFWPPLRILKVLKAWRETPARAASLLKRHQLPARVVVMGHTHRRGVTRTPEGILVFNTGSFCPPCAGGVVDVSESAVRLRAIIRRGNEFRLGETIAE